MRHTFKVYERLKKEQHINTLFRQGKAFSVFPLKLIYLVCDRALPAHAPCMAGFSVPKKKFGSSVHRHRIRRLMAEAWRLNKHVLYELTPDHIQLQLFFICTDKNMPAYADVEKAVVLAIEQLKKVVRAKVV